MGFTRAFLVVLMALTMLAWVAQEDIREDDTVFNRCEMLQRARFQVLGQCVPRVSRGSSFTTQSKTGKSASAEVSTKHLTLLSSCILRC